MMDAEDIHEFHYEDGHHRKTYRVSFIPVETLEYEYVVEAESEDDAYDAAEEQLQEAIGWDAAKDFQLNDLEEQTS
ncbi:MAG: hypothetical protein CMP84_01850 [Gammaproteobacteria bacterium]|jgi:hypothetical protein|nr:hypothetical protein [Gammaproteobacteria bacterium]